MSKHLSYLSAVLIDDSNNGVDGIFLLQQLQAWCFRVRNVPQSVLTVVISGVAVFGQQWLRTAGVHWDLWSKMYERGLKTAEVGKEGWRLMTFWDHLGGKAK